MTTEEHKALMRKKMDEKFTVGGIYVNSIIDENPSHAKQMCFNVADNYGDKIHYGVVDDYYIYYLNTFGIEVRPQRYIDTVPDYNFETEAIDRYAADFYKDGKKLEVIHEKYHDYRIIIGDHEYINRSEYNGSVEYYKGVDWRGFTERVLQVYYVKWENLVDIEMNCKGVGKRLCITNDKAGNIEISLDENADIDSFITIRGRKSGKKFYIKVGNEHYEPKRYVDALVSLIDKNNDPTVAKMFEIVIRDPRVEERVGELLEKMPKSYDEAFNKYKADLDKEYQEKVEALRIEFDRALKRKELPVGIKTVTDKFGFERPAPKVGLVEKFVTSYEEEENHKKK